MKPETYFVPQHPALEVPDLEAILASPLLIFGTVRYWGVPEVPGPSSFGAPANVWIFSGGIVTTPGSEKRSAEERTVDAFVSAELRRREEAIKRARGSSAPMRSLAGTALHIAGHVMLDAAPAIGWLALPVTLLGVLVEGEEPELPPISRAFWDDVNRRRLAARMSAGAAIDVLPWPVVEHVTWRTANRWIVPEYFMSFARAGSDGAPRSGCTWTAQPDYRLLTAGESMLARLRHEIASLALKFIGSVLPAPHYEAFRERELQALRAKHEESWPFSGDVASAIDNIAPPDERAPFAAHAMLRDVNEKMVPLHDHYARVPNCAPVLEKLAAVDGAS